MFIVYDLALSPLLQRHKILLSCFKLSHVCLTTVQIATFILLATRSRMIQRHNPKPLTNDSLFINVYDGCLGGPKRLGVFVFTLQLSPLQAQPWTQSFVSSFPLEQVCEKRAEWCVVTVARRLQWVG